MYFRSASGSGAVSHAAPAVVRRGFAVVAAGGVVDVVYHLTPRQPGLLVSAGLAGHLITLFGMVIVMVGVLSVGLRNRHP